MMSTYREVSTEVSMLAQAHTSPKLFQQKRSPGAPSV